MPRYGQGSNRFSGTGAPPYTPTEPPPAPLPPPNPWDANYGGQGGPLSANYGQRQSFFGSNPTMGDWLNQALNNTFPIQPGQKPSQGAAYVTSSLFPQLQGAGGIANSIGFANLTNLLANQGRIAPQQMNQQLTQISREGQGRTEALRGELASRGLQNSGVGLALGAASNQATGNQLAQRRAQEDEAAYGRNLQALQMLYQLIIGPQLDVAGFHFGNLQGQRADDAQRTAALMAMFGRGIGAAAGGA